MKILNLNVWQGRLERVLLKHLETLDVDFACMQEAVDYPFRSAGLVGTYQAVGESLRLEHSFFSSLSSMKLGSKDIKFGNVIYSNTDFHETNTVFTRGEYKKDIDLEKDDYNVKAFQHSKIVKNGKVINILNHHGHHINEHKLGDEETLRQVKLIINYIEDLEGAIILCGDFNLSPESESVKLIEEKLTNLSTRYGLKTTRSKLTYKKEVCDFIFVNDEVIINNFKMDDTIISDHNALLLDFDLK